MTLARAIRRGGRALLREPTRGLVLRDDREDLDGCLCNVIKHPDLVYPEAILRPLHAPKPLDATPTDLGGLVPQVLFDCASDPRSHICPKSSKFSDGARGQDDLEPHLARL